MIAHAFKLNHQEAEAGGWGVLGYVTKPSLQNKPNSKDCKFMLVGKRAQTHSPLPSTLAEKYFLKSEGLEENTGVGLLHHKN